MTSRSQSEEEYRRLQREQDDLLEENLGQRAGIYRRALIFTPLAVASIFAFLFAFNSLIAGNIGAVLGSGVLGIIAFALSFEAVAALRDLRATPIRSAGPTERVWVKSKFLVFGRTGYLLLNGRVFEIRVDTSMLIEAGQPVTIEHWPHTNLVVTLHRGAEASSAD